VNAREINVMKADKGMMELPEEFTVDVTLVLSRVRDPMR
jgi:hypothetical protein